ncbi:putative selenate reductase subunit YgfK [Acetonema longum]|uniref:dihydrouracil dehydrogenase (NAD(+)) n=1 Tax=Acetonema longum DSM 6540 TaxID=1009370 RepID=F7NDB9_9FIRM|nr:putative selenate reductase subunit YgfK [Acetonema longum]EGO65951.1 putative selenate reductase subunit YgfK [Acetonema longum DSM 6540]
MGDLMRPIPFRELICRIFQEYSAGRSVFALPESSFFRKTGGKAVSIFGESCEMPLGPAAGPHTQLAQNIITSYLAGSRFIELKTVQEKEPPVEKPCIDAQDEGFNTEWSSEYTLEKAYDEYIKAWILLHLIEEVFELRSGKDRSFVFNMSVGYTMEGIRLPRMDRYINSLIDAAGHPSFERYRRELKTALQDGGFLKGTGRENRLPAILDLPERISAKICQSVTLSTMHGCPPAEIEKICAYMLTEKKLQTFVKLNPTLLSFPTVRRMLDDLGFDYVPLKQESFDHDLQYQDAIPMLKRLVKLAADHNRFFGVKLTNTLGAVNFKKQLPGGEMYMSGRALFPLSINLAAKVCREFDGKLPISFSAGISEHNVEEVFAAGIQPITLATELLKPGGYNRLSAIAAKLEAREDWGKTSIDVGKVEALAGQSLSAGYVRKHYRDTAKISIPGGLPLFDCAEAPCKAACPIHQDIPEYIQLVGQKRYAEALELIYEKNPLPSITGHICDHACQYHCTRMDYEGSVLIREIKRIAVKKGFDEYRKRWGAAAKIKEVKVAVLGAGPAGLAAAYFLTREGFGVTVFDPRESAGGTVRHVIPRFRISDAAIDSDVNFIRDHGVEFVFRSDPGLTPAALRSQGYKYVVVAVGADAEKPFSLEGGSAQVIPALKFLEQYNKAAASLRIGKHVAVIGAGNTAMDAARTALKVAGVETSCVVYRRTEKEMPAYREEYELAAADQVQFHFLLNPEKLDGETLVCRVMKLGEPAAGGRRKPEPTGELRSMKIDTVITAIGEEVDQALLQSLGIGAVNRETGETALPGVYLAGDACTGPSSIVKGIAAARQTADAICRAENPAWSRSGFVPPAACAEQVRGIRSKKLGLTWQAEAPVDSSEPVNPAVGAVESSRCLECSYVCNKCVEVCPNRANMAVHLDGFHNYYQIVHVDAYCNECGNCATFCPWDGRPYTDKLTLFSLKQDFAASKNPGFLVQGDAVLVRCEGAVQTLPLKNGVLTAGAAGSVLANLCRIFNKLYAEQKALFGPVDE